MDDDGRHTAQGTGTTGTGTTGTDPGTDPGTADRAGVLGTALAGVLAFSLSSGSWQWFSTYLGLTLLAVVFAFSRPPSRTPGAGARFARSLAAYALVVGLAAALALAPAMQRWAWLFPMPETRSACAHLGRYAELGAQAALGDLAGQDAAALAYAQSDQARHAVDDCLAAPTTRWLPVYGLAAAVLAVLAVWLADRSGTRRRAAAPEER
ncbi:hypothetical protein ACIRS1_07495 [Kitasatospora sp. NPDC101176]|uniref:hypothetical protein n=1 Tax=Kitasatospora sp. NPDC101176 TaxID=3364099 RepID=UPI0038270918